MARVTVEDCIEKLPDRFELVMIASQRARKISSGAALTVDRDNDKNPVVALREIADSTIDVENVKEELIRGYQRILISDDEDEEVIDLMEGEEEWNAIAARSSEEEDTAEEEEDYEPSLEEIAGEKPEETDL